MPSTQISPPTFPDTPLKCAAYKVDSIPNLNPTPETPKPDKKDEPATNISHSEHFIDQMYEKMHIEKIKRDLMKDLKCEIKELISREKENLEIKAANELETKYTALLMEVERLRNALDKRDQRINNLIDSIKDISIHRNKNLSEKSPLYSFESNNTSPANTPSNNYDNNIITTRRKEESLTATSFASLQSEIHYYREENRDKTLIIKQLIENNTIACKCNNFKYDILNNKENEESSNYLVQSLKSKSNKNLTLLKKIDDKNTKSDSMETEEKHINDMNKSGCNNNNIDKYCDIKDDQKKDDQRKDNKKENVKKKVENKDEKKKSKEKDKKSEKSNRKNNEKESKNNNNMSREKQKSVHILGDSIIKKVNGYFLTKKLRHKYLVKVRSFPGAKISCMVDHVKPTIREDTPDNIILHAGTNDLRSEKTSSQIAKAIIELAMSLKTDENSVIVSSIVPRFDNLNNKANEVNNRLVHICRERDIPFISHTESIDPSKHLNESKFHLNFNDVKIFAENLSTFLSEFN